MLKCTGFHPNRNPKILFVNKQQIEMPYHVILSDSDEESVVGVYPTLEEAKQHLAEVRYYPSYRRSEESLDISEDGMTGTGYDCEGGDFTYTIKIA